MDTSKIDVELPHVSHLTETGLQEITRRIVAAAKPVKVILFGSRAWGRFSPAVLKPRCRLIVEM